MNSQKSEGSTSRLMSVAREFESEGIFTGGPVEIFEEVGRLQIYTLIREGLYPYSKLLDIGCGCLRGGYWSIHFLNSGCYYGIEPNRPMLEAGIHRLLENDVLATKKPKFDYNDRFDFSVFGETFDAVIARSIWTHTSKSQIKDMLDHFVKYTNPKAFILTSYLPAKLWPPAKWDYQGDHWVGKDHHAQVPGLIYHSTSRILRECEKRKLVARRLNYGDVRGQVWLKITKGSEAI